MHICGSDSGVPLSNPIHLWQYPVCLLRCLEEPAVSPPRAWPAAHCFKCHAGDFLQGVPEYLQPLLLSKGVLLGTNHVDVVGNIVSRVVPCLSLPLGEKPGRDLLGRGCITFNSKTQHRMSQRQVRSRASGGFKTGEDEGQLHSYKSHWEQMP